MEFTQEHLDAFFRLSGDQNPLHLDPIYARRTPFGKVVVYGMASALLGLGLWAKGRPFRLLSVKAQFKKPLHLNEDYRFEFTEKGQTVTFQIFKGPALQTKISWQWQESPPLRNQQLPEKFAALQEHDEYRYAIDSGEWGQFSEHFLLSLSQLPLEQIQFLLWSSYYVGMEYPGRQALFSDFQVRFVEAKSEDLVSADLRISFSEKSLDPRFNQVTLRGSASAAEAFEIHAFSRPPSVQNSLFEEAATIPGNPYFADRSAFISGAGRGFGSVLAQALANSGATIAINHRTSDTEFDTWAAKLLRQNPKSIMLQADLLCEESMSRISQDVEKSIGPLDLLVANASPSIHAKLFLEQSSSEWATFLQASVSMTSHLFRYLLPQMRPGGTVVLISSIFTQTIPAQFSHYVAAKAAQEGMMKSLSLEFPRLHFLTARLPKMLTDQTNTILPATDTLSPVHLAKELLEQITKMPHTSGIIEWSPQVPIKTKLVIPD